MNATEKNQAWLRDYYRAIDAGETDAYMAMFTDDARMIFANADPIEGHDGIREALTGLLGSVDGIRHVLHQAGRSRTTSWPSSATSSTRARTARR